MCVKENVAHIILFDIWTTMPAMDPGFQFCGGWERIPSKTVCVFLIPILGWLQSIL